MLGKLGLVLRSAVASTSDESTALSFGNAKRGSAGCGSGGMVRLILGGVGLNGRASWSSASVTQGIVFDPFSKSPTFHRGVDRG